MRTTPTIWCTIQRVQPRPSWRQADVAVTVADRDGTAVTIALTTADLETYASFQAAVLCATGSPFRYLPGVAPQCSPEAEPAWLAGISPHRLGTRWHAVTAVPLVLKRVVRRVLVGLSVVSAE